MDSVVDKSETTGFGMLRKESQRSCKCVKVEHQQCFSVPTSSVISVRRSKAERTAKLFMQRLWKLKNEDKAPYEWDHPLPQKLQDEWKQFHATLPILADIRITRFVSLAAISKVELHFFCGASDAAYGACCFTRSLNNDQSSVILGIVRKSTKSSNIILTTADLVVTDHTLIRLAQSQLYSEELAELTSSTSNDVLKSSPLKWLKPHVDDNGIIRVGGRLSNAEVPDTVKYPMVLSSSHPLAQLLAGYYHKFLLHAGPQLMLATMRQKYWIISGRNLVRHAYHQCVKCFRNKPILIQQSVADLPKSRVTPARPFAISGVDYCGPVFLKSTVRNRGPTKAYIAIFVCFSTKAVHIELVTDLSTPAFLAALRRFVARRGLVRELHSDNGTAFKGAANALHRIYEMLKSSETDRAHIQTWCAENQIQWKFIPPRAPHFGGLWEAAVKSAKHHLLREIGHISIRQENMTTLLTQIEMCLNSRPLTPIPCDPTDLEVLTPGHFLVGSNLQSVPEPSYVDTPDNRLDHWQITQKLFQRIWARWYPEYLAQLQSRAAKGCKAPVPIKVGQIVVIKDENLPPAQWPLGRITQLHPGKDGIVRVVTMKTANANSVVRPVAKIAILPVPTKDHQPK
ncbi:uncharacterized protein LOC135714960 [Ochlerotatus camptorhynchus]|uniref:uncharacterized protein LOC135714960 n=1 Tax=Ochlerotatus camptorhynchus TaxID=644619 RepID=UPI0031D9CFFF